MSFLEKIRTDKNFEDNSRQKTESLSRIKAVVAQKTGIDKVIEAGDCAVAFAGSKDNMKLLLELSIYKCGNNKRFLYASLDDGVSWQEDDFESAAEFEAAIADYIAERLGRTVKTVTVIDKGKVVFETYYLDADEWVLLSSETVNGKMASFLAKKLKISGESTETYTPVAE